jgi:hypothetical protein
MPSLTTSGTPTANGDSTVTIDSTGSDRVKAPYSVLNATTGWFAARLVTPTVVAGVIEYVFGWRADASNYMNMYLGETAQGGEWRFVRSVAGASNEAHRGNQAAGTDDTVIAQWTGTTIGVSRMGSAWAAGTIADTHVVTFSGTFFDIGSRGDGSFQLGTKMYWCCAGTGTLTDADAAALYTAGNSDPNWQDIPGTVSFLWKCVDFTYEDSAPGAGGASSSQNVLMLGVG